MSKLPLKLRLFINVVIFVIPIAVLTFLMYSSETVNIDFSEKELKGVSIHQDFQKALEGIDKTQFEKSSGDYNLENLSKNWNLLSQDLLLDASNLKSRGREAASLDFIRKWTEAKDWAAATNSLKLAVTHIGDTSNLILDPDLDSYYLMDVTLLALPQLQDRLRTLSAFLEKIKDPAAPGNDALIQAAVIAQMLEESDLGRIEADTQTVLNEDKNFYGELPDLNKHLTGSLAELQKPTKDLIAVLRKFSAGEKVDVAEIRNLLIKASTVSYQSWFTDIKVLERLLQTRVHALVEHRTTAISYAGLALLATILLSILIGSTISRSIRSILSSVLNLKDAAVESSKIGNDLHDLSTEVFQQISNQVAAIEQTAASIEEVNSMLKLSLENTNQASSVSKEASEMAQKGEREISTVLNSMQDISGSSRRIVETISIIDDIAFQTNLLALNASVEAARAGEQGKGFAVVADAVRTLATKSATAAKEINNLVSDNLSLVEQSKKRADLAGVQLKEIVSSVQKISSINTEIAKATTEQVQGLDQITHAINDFERSSSKNQESITAVSEVSTKALDQNKLLVDVVDSLEAELRGKKRQKIAESGR